MTEFGRHVSIIFTGLVGGSLRVVGHHHSGSRYIASAFRLTTAGPWPVMGDRGAEAYFSEKGVHVFCTAVFTVSAYGPACHVINIWGLS